MLKTTGIGIFTERNGEHMTCGVTGHRPSGFYFARNESERAFTEYKAELYRTAEDLVLLGYDKFISGMADGADTDFAEAVILLKKKYSRITLEAALPCPIYIPKKYTPFHKRRDSLLRACDTVSTVSDRYYRGCMSKRNKYIVDSSDLILAIWNGARSGGTWNTIEYSRNCRRQIKYIMLTDFIPSV